MTQEKKDLLLKDLCARLPYGVKCSFGVDDSIYEICGINPVNCGASEIQATHIKSGINGDFVINACKPYLFPLSSMTKKQKNSFPFSYSFLEALINGGICLDEIECITLNDMNDVIQGCYKNHLDIHGLIPKGLAIDATGLNIYSNKSKPIMTIELKKLEYLNKELGTDYNSLNKVDWRMVSKNHKLSEDFIREFQNEVDWKNISIYQKLSEDFIREFSDKIEWWGISEYQKLSEDFIREFKDKVDWAAISHNQNLSEDFIRDFQDKVSWIAISWKQKLSESFIREFENKVCWEYILKYQKLSENFIREFKYLTKHTYLNYIDI